MNCACSILKNRKFVNYSMVRPSPFLTICSPLPCQSVLTVLPVVSRSIVSILMITDTRNTSTMEHLMSVKKGKKNEKNG